MDIRLILLAALGLAIGVLATYQNSFDKPFVFDDQPAILENPTITQLWPPWTALSPPKGTGSSVGGRPLINYSFALNYAVSGYEVWSYHAFNLIIHVLVAWILFGIVRRTLLRPVLAERLGTDALPLAFFIALAWAVHPLLTETVTCVVQRTESLGAMFYLLVLYCFIRSLDSSQANGWRAGAVIACLLGVATKETVVTVPVLVLLYDRTFVAGTFAAAWRTRRKFYAALAGTWLLLAGLMLGAEQRGGTVGFGLGMTWWQYALKQCEAVPHYFALAVWPHPLAVDYGYGVVNSLTAVWPQALALALLLVTTGWALARRPRLGFIGAWVFIILAPSSSIVPLTTQTEAEHRMYLPLAAMVALAVVGLYEWVGRRAYALVAIVALAWGWLTFQRNTDYQTVNGLWRNDVATVPTNARAHKNLGTAFGRMGLGPACIQEYELSLQLDPTNAEAESDLGIALAAGGQTDEALIHYRRAVALKPDEIAKRVDLANFLKQMGRLPEAIAEYQTALRSEPDSADVKIDLGDAYNTAGQPEVARPYYQSAIALKPASGEAHLGLGNSWVLLNQWDDAAKEYTAALKLDAHDYLARYSLGVVFSHEGNTVLARNAFQQVLREQPDFAPARRALAALRPVETSSGLTPPPK
jgi:protein O-mannosyl-transferase